ncbi:hypothetical protein UP10_35350 [Bradyrhizobium sp. LTSPM299]|uniref:hypothetical protein n=1 Tax=Bradyrhizobium sp. LTSPM299 TaxID=1619233 RepID=UPI0005DCA112|nr:hypothetical protein [Bradyrhizobium sp. LTSPM299]KJC56293.1 hypothetical protein UP10_35350 [Bradyrhizobium sp. LTSPM299]
MGWIGLDRMPERYRLPVLIYLHVATICLSLACVAYLYSDYHIFFRRDGLLSAIVVAAAFSTVASLFVYAEFSFGYFAGFYLFTMIAGYLWLNQFSESIYNHALSGLSAAASAVAFLLPALFIRSRLPQYWTLSPKALDRLVDVILVLGAVVVSVGATYDFQLVSVEHIYDYRESLRSPRALNYLMGIMSGALLPFAFACCVELKKNRRAMVALLLLLAFYPVTVSKLALLTSAWLVVMTILSRVFELRIAVVVSLLAPLTVGLLLFALFEFGWASYQIAIPYFGLVNFRMIAIPSLAMDYYNDFFFKHDLTYYCQIGLFKPLMSCPYDEPLSVVIYKAFGIGGYFNASLFATEGVASIGALFAPVAALACGLVIGLANRASANLPPRFVMVSGAVLVQLLLNVPFTTVLLTHGAILLFLLWYITPLTTAERSSDEGYPAPGLPTSR